MKHKTLLLQRLCDTISVADQPTAKLLLEGTFTSDNTLRGFTRDVNNVLRGELTKATADENLIDSGCYPLSTPENWDAVNYWLCDIHKHYVPALKQAKETQRENTASA